MASTVAFHGEEGIVNALSSDADARPAADATLVDDVHVPASATPPHVEATHGVWQVRLANACFLLIGIGVAMAWTALRAGIAYFSGKFPLGTGA